MAAPIQKVAQLAHKTFAVLSSSSQEFCQDKLQTLVSLTSKIRAKDLNFDQRLVAEPSSKNDIDPNCAPVTYVHLWEDKIMSMGIFVLKRGARLPLHNHPNMYGVCKVIHGTLNIESYSTTNAEVPENILRRVKPSYLPLLKSVKLESNHELSAEDDCCVLTPTVGNIHEIRSINGPAAFLDILAPPYDHDTGVRVCHYYQIIEEPPRPCSNSDTNQSNPSINQWLIRTSQPKDFWCDTEEYRGPPLLNDL